MLWLMHVLYASGFSRTGTGTGTGTVDLGDVLVVAVNHGEKGRERERWFIVRVCRAGQKRRLDGGSGG